MKDNDVKNPLDKKEFLQELFLDEKDGKLAVLRVSDLTIWTEDFEEEKKITYRTGPITKAWLASKIHFCNGAKRYEASLKDQMAEFLLSMDPMMMITLRHVFFVSRPEDKAEICSMLKTDDDWFPDAIDLEDQDGCLGCYWWYRNSVIINIAQHEKTIQEMQDEYSCFSIYDMEEELYTGLFVTLAHEIRHLGMANPYLPVDYDTDDDEERDAEAWGRSVYEKWQEQKNTAA